MKPPEPPRSWSFDASTRATASPPASRPQLSPDRVTEVVREMNRTDAKARATKVARLREARLAAQEGEVAPSTRTTRTMQPRT